MSKNLYIIITDSGDGSNSLSYTFDEALVDKMSEREDELDDCYQSGDGLQIDTLLVPDECTYESLGIPKWSIQEDPFGDLPEEEMGEE